MAIKNTQNDNESLNDVAVGDNGHYYISGRVPIVKLLFANFYGIHVQFYSVLLIYLWSHFRNPFSDTSYRIILQLMIVAPTCWYDFEFFFQLSIQLKIFNVPSISPFAIRKLNSTVPFIRSIYKKFFDSLTVKLSFNGLIEPSIEPIIPTKYCT